MDDCKETRKYWKLKEEALQLLSLEDSFKKRL
jgi:tryptophan 2,3-dioxygenase